MASQHARAVQLRRKEFGDEINYNLALCIALHMGNDGKPARLAISTLAEHGFCHYNTADKRLKELTAYGLIKMSKAGKLFDYSIPGQYEDEETGPTNPDDISSRLDNVESRLDALETKLDGLVKIVEKLSHHLHTIVTPSSHELHTNFTPADNENVNEVEKKGRREEVEEPPKPPLPEMPIIQEPFKPKYSRLVPVALQENRFLDIWASYEEFRDSSRKPLSEFVAKRQLAKMAKWGIDKAITAMNNTMDNGYDGLIEPKPSKNGNSGSTDGQSFDDWFENIEVTHGN